MNSKAIRKQLLAAVAMVLVAAVALGSSTYAWFVASGTVTATGMMVQAQADGNLVIAYKGEEWVSTATAGMTEVRKLSPTSTKDLSTWVWAKAASAAASDANVATFENKTALVRPATSGKDDADADNGCTNSPYALVKYFKIRAASDASTPKGLYVPAIEVTGKVNTMSTALRVGIECEYYNGTAYVKTHKIFAPVEFAEGTEHNKPTTTYEVMVPSDSGFSRQEIKVDNINDQTNSDQNAILVPSTIAIDETHEVKLYIFVWLEGEDDNLYSDNFYADNLSVSVKFTSLSDTSANSANEAPINLKDATAVAEPTTVDGVNYYAITGKTTHTGKQLYAKAAGAVTSGPIYTITNSVATEFTNVSFN